MIGWTTRVDRRTNETLLRAKKMETEPTMCGVINVETTKSVDRGQSTFPYSLMRSVNLDWFSIDWHYLSRTWNSPHPFLHSTLYTDVTGIPPQTAFAAANKFLFEQKYLVAVFHPFSLFSLSSHQAGLIWILNQRPQIWPESWKPPSRIYFIIQIVEPLFDIAKQYFLLDSAPTAQSLFLPLSHN